MLYHILTFARRLINRQRTYALINILGLVLGLTSVLLAFVIIRDESGYDQFHTDSQRIFRVNKWVQEDSGDRFKTAETAGKMGPTMVEEFPEAEAASRFQPWFEPVLLTRNRQSLEVTHFAFADSNFFHLFDFELLRGKPEEVLSRPGQLLLTPSLARVLFGEEDPVGQTLTGFDDQIFTVAGIIEEAPRRSHLQYQAVASWASTEPGAGFLDFNFMNNWLGQTVFTYVRLREAPQKAAVEAGLTAFTARHMSNRTEMYDFYLQPLEEVYLQSQDIRYLRGLKYGSIGFLHTFTIIALLVLLVACFNYINISTARSIQRGKEVGVRKVMGARRGQLLAQFLTETFLFVLTAGLLALTLAYHLIHPLNHLFDLEVPQATVYQPATLLFLSLIAILTSLAAGLLPAWVLSRFRPITALRGDRDPDLRLGWARQALTGLQLALSIGLIAGTLILNRQFRFLLSQDLGFDKEQVLVMNTPPGIEAQATAFRNELSRHPSVRSVSICQAAIGRGTFGTTVIPEGSNGREVAIQSFRVDPNFLNTYGMQLAAGRFFSTEYPADTSYGSLVVNEALVRQMGWEDPLKRTVRYSAEGEPIPIVGVVKDFHFNSLRQPIGPVIMHVDPRKHNISVRFDRDQAGAVLAHLRSLWQRFEPRHPFDYYFLDEHFAGNYLAEKQMLRIISAFSLIALLIAGLGLYGLATFTVTRRYKEISIRKVLGASTGTILLLLHQRLAYLTLAGFLLAAPLTYYYARNWLENYAYAVEIPLWIFLLAGLLTLTIAGTVVLLQSLRAALANPAEALRTE